MISGLYSTLTNVNFDEHRFNHWLNEVDLKIAEVKNLYETSSKNPVKFEFYESDPKVDNTGVKNGWHARVLDEETAALHELVQYGLKGCAAYSKEALNHDKWNEGVVRFMNKAMAFLSDAANSCFSEQARDPKAILDIALECGKNNIQIMEDLSEGHKSQLGVPSPTQVRTVPVPGKCILVSGHDMHVLENILKQTEGTGINVYTHGELLPAHGYPKLRKYKHLVGNYGTAWQVQKMEFNTFPGAVVVTTNCILEPRKSYIDRVFTTGVVGVNGVKHIPDMDFTPVIEKALEMKGFDEKDISRLYKRSLDPVTVGFGHDFVLSIAPTIINAVKKGYIKRFFLIGGCDGSESERSYYKQLSTTLGKDTIMLTLGCAKYRINGIDHGTITVPFSEDGEVEESNTVEIPRLLDMGQCNDAYSAIQVAGALANAFKTDLNSLPISYAISWFEQKAVAVFLSMMYLGVRNIRLGPRTPAFLTPNTLKFLHETFNLNPNTEVEVDLPKMMQGN